MTAEWIDRKIDDPEDVLPLVGPHDAEQMEAFAVSIYVNDTLSVTGQSALGYGNLGKISKSRITGPREGTGC
jgi:hypothetical protein